MRYAGYFKSGLGNFINAIPAFILMASIDERECIDLILDGDWIHDPRVPAIKCIAENSYYIESIKYWPDVQLDDYYRFLIPVQCEQSKCAREMMRRNKETGLKSTYYWPNPNWRDCMLHEIDVNLLNLKAIGYDGDWSINHYIPMQSVGSEAIPPWGRHLSFGLCNGAFQAKFWEKKKWHFFRDLSILLKKYFKGCKIVGIGGPKELDGCNLDYDYTGKTNIMQTSYIISNLDYFVTTDTGCMHIADVLKTKGIVLFGPTDICKNGPVCGSMKAVRKNYMCAPCYEDEGFYTCNSHACMYDMTPSMVMERVIKDFV